MMQNDDLRQTYPENTSLRAASKAPMVGCYEISKQYGSAFALNQVNLELPAGEIIGLLGPNGSGKTTLIKILAGILQPTKGSVLVGGVPVGTDTKSIVSYLPERTYFNVGMRVKECVNLFTDFYEDFDRERALKMLDSLGVPLEAKLKTLSKGNREKVQLVLVMSRRAKLYLLDEPIGGVDPATRDYILATILSACDPESTILISTHLIHDVEHILNGYIFLYNGCILKSGDADAAREESGKSLDEQFREVFKCF